MSEFGQPVVPGQNIDRRLINDEFNQNVIYDDAFVQVEEKPPFSQNVSEQDLLLFESPGFNNPIISKAHNYTQDYFELRAQPSQSTGGDYLPLILTENIDVNVSGYLLNIKDGNDTVSSMISITPSGSYLYSFSRPDQLNNEWSGNVASYSNDSNSVVWMEVYGAGNFRSIVLSTNVGMIVTDDFASKGLEYAGDYSANFTDHSLVSKKWVTDNAAIGSFIPLSEEPMPILASIEFTRDVDDKVETITTTNAYGVKTVDFIRDVNGKVTDIEIDNYGTTARKITFTRDVNGKVTDIDIVNLV